MTIRNLVRLNSVTPYLLLATTLLSQGTLAGKWHYEQFDSHQKLKVEGTLLLEKGQRKDPSVGRRKQELQVGGVKHLRSVGGKVVRQDGRIMGGEVRGDTVFLNLDYMYDNNVILDGKLKGELITGRWFHSTFAGIRERGTFTMSRIK